MNLLENPVCKYLLLRFKEPSSWSALGALLIGVGILNPGEYQHYVTVFGGILSVLGFALPEGVGTETVPALPVKQVVADGGT